jgi:hypothetical protein
MQALAVFLEEPLRLIVLREVTVTCKVTVTWLYIFYEKRLFLGTQSSIFQPCFQYEAY